MSAPIFAADLFCGMGGSSSGARRALTARGRALRLVAVNHWDVAIEAHERVHPYADHRCSNVYRLAPRDAVPTGQLDLLMASPTCTYYSRARGGRPISRQQRYGRMTPTQVVRWVNELRPRLLMVENVPEFVEWGPVHPGAPPARCEGHGCTEGRPCRRRRGYYFRPWLRKLQAAGYHVEWRVLCAADYGDATTRQRFFLLGRSDGKPIHWPAPTHSKGGHADLWGERAPWRPAREVIDWSIRGRSIFRRKKPLSPKTLRRIRAGAVRFGWPEVFVEALDLHLASKSVEHLLASEGARPTAFSVVLRRNADGRSLEAPLPTVTAGGTHIGLVEPFVLSQASGGAPRAVRDPLPTATTKGAHALVYPYYGQSECRDAESPLPTVTTRDRFGVVEPFIAASFGERPGQRPRVHSVNDPAPTICAGGRVQLVEGDQRAQGIDVLFRMLRPEELARATGLDPRGLAGATKTDQVKLVGNAVPVGVAAALVGALVGS